MSGRDFMDAQADEDLLAELAWHLPRASRMNPNGSSRKQIRKLLDTPRALDLLERILAERRRGSSG